MASIIKKIKKGRPYYYAVQSGRVDGKPRIVWQKYLGTIDAIVKRVEQTSPPKPKESVIFEAGGVAMLLRIAQQLGVINLINEVVKKRDQGPSVGHYMILAAINRALAPCSKLAIADWYADTILHRLWQFSKKSFSSQRFWDHMDMISEETIEMIQQRLALKIKQEFGIDGRLLLYDTSNFFTFLATTNDRCTIAQRGHSKAKRNDLRQVGLALLVTREFHVPLFHRVYPGNIPDVNLFPELVKELIAYHDEILGTSKDLTLVFDKGNVSDDAMERLVISESSFVAAVSANRVPELLSTPLDKFQDVSGFSGTKAFTTKTMFWGKECCAVVVYTESFFTKQLSSLTTNLAKSQNKLAELENSLQKKKKSKARGKRPTVRTVETKIQSILSPQFMKDLFQITIEKKQGLPVLHYAVKHDALDQLIKERLGRTVLVTNNTTWSSEDVISAYRSLASIEETFKNMKNIDFLHWQPANHWTDQKLKVHGFYCVLALTLVTIAQKIARKSGIYLTIPGLLKELTAIREVAVIYPHGTLAHRKDHITLSRMSPQQRKLAELFNISKIILG